MKSAWVLLVLVQKIAGETFRLSNVFGDHMVLQRDRPVKVWGFDAPGNVVSVSSSGDVKVAAKSTYADRNGVWRITLPANPATIDPTNFVFSNTAGEQVPGNYQGTLFKMSYMSTCPFVLCAGVPLGCSLR